MGFSFTFRPLRCAARSLLHQEKQRSSEDGTGELESGGGMHLRWRTFCLGT